MNNPINSIVVAGDTMLDLYWQGKVNRISPEAPVPILDYASEECRLGGAANVAANLVAQQHPCTLIGIIGADIWATQLKNLLANQGIDYQLITDDSSCTITKLRILQQIQQLVRIDREQGFSKRAVDQVLATFKKTISVDTSAIILSDYAKGTLDNTAAFIETATHYKVPIIIDPKGSDYSKYANSFCLTPNENEFKNVVGAINTEHDFETKMAELSQHLNLGCLLVTRGEAGMSLWSRGCYYHLAAQSKRVYDVSGAGDTVIATFAANLSLDNPYQLQSNHFTNLVKAMQVANHAAALAVIKPGTATVSSSELKGTNNKLITHQTLDDWLQKNRQNKAKIAFTNGCFDILHVGHIDCLQQAAKTADKLLVAVNTDQSVKRLKGANRPINTLVDRLQLLMALTCVDAVIAFGDDPQDQDAPLRLIKHIKPDVLVKGGDYQSDAVIGAEEVQDYGGQVQIVPFKTNYSTTKTIHKIQS